MAFSGTPDTGGVEGHGAAGPSRASLAAEEPPPASPGSRVGAASGAELGRQRVDSVVCPHCGARDIARRGQASAFPRYRCKACSRTFDALAKTPLANLRMKNKWAAQTEAPIEGVGTAKAARRCGVRCTTPFRWRHRFLASLAGDKPKTLSGIVEGDETFILESFKGKRPDMPRKSRKRGGKSAKRGLSAEQISVIVARDRHGAATDAVLPKLNRASGRDRRPRPADAGQTKSEGAGFSPRQRQRLPWPPEGMAAPVPRRGHEKPPLPSRLASDLGGAGTECDIALHDPRSHRFGAISTNRGGSVCLHG